MRRRRPPTPPGRLHPHPGERDPPPLDRRNNGGRRGGGASSWGGDMLGEIFCRREFRLEFQDFVIEFHDCVISTFDLHFGP
jgi:hypothetical protein